MITTITLVGLGPGDPGMITRAAWEVISTTRVLYLRTAVHPTVAALPSSVIVHAFDDLYEQAERFDEVYERIANELIARARGGEPVVYATPGDPLTAEATSRHLLRRARAQGIPVRIISGVSFVQPVCALLGVWIPWSMVCSCSMPLTSQLTIRTTSGGAPSWASLHGFHLHAAVAAISADADAPCTHWSSLQSGSCVARQTVADGTLPC
ncbi:MAG: SAM-dependent methyltransferase [Roseiflexaceae bacterium]|nr:SAM-dependent methyltransferase [Roseiflexaceae bacterium]